MLDILKDFKTIPDTENGQVIRYMLQKFRELALGEMSPEADLIDTLKRIHDRLEKVKWDI